MPKTLTKRIFHGVTAVSITTLMITSIPSVANAQSSDNQQPLPAMVQKSKPAIVTDQFIVGFSGSAKTKADQRAKAYGKSALSSGVAVKEIRTTATGASVVRVTKNTTVAESQKFMNSLRSDPNVTYVEPDTIMQTQSETSNPSYPTYTFPDQWNLFDTVNGINILPAWEVSTGSDRVIAVIDTGITYHSDLNDQILPGYDMISNAEQARDGDGRDSNPRDEGTWGEVGQCDIPEKGMIPSSWHGTHVAGIIAATRGNNLGIDGAAPDAKVVPIRALGTCGSGRTSDIVDGIIWASGGTVPGTPENTYPARIINLSLSGFGSCSTTYQNAVNQANARGASVFVAAGNNREDASLYEPANCENVITVASSGPTGNSAWYSNYGPTIDITAPGGDTGGLIPMFPTGGIKSTVNLGQTIPGDEGYGIMQGTSMAAPTASAVGALLLSHDPSMTPAQLEARLKETARPLSGSCYKGCGAGLVDPAAALNFSP